jgi:hypothetical protein
LSQNGQHPYSQLLDLTHRLQMSDDCCMVKTHSLANSRVV